MVWKRPPDIRYTPTGNDIGTYRAIQFCKTCGQGTDVTEPVGIPSRCCRELMSVISGTEGEVETYIALYGLDIR